MRIIAGKLKGLVLKTFEAENIRPTLDRAREGVFSKIQFIISGAYVLDLFAGTGAISLEFISRGAKKVITCDNNKKSIDIIKQNFSKAKINPNLKLGDYLEVLLSLKNEKFDIIFLDPPFATDFGEKAIDFLIENNMLNGDSLIIFEHSSEKNVNYRNEIELFDVKKYGYITFDFLRLK